MQKYNNITNEYSSIIYNSKEAYQDFIDNHGPYKYFISITPSRNYTEQQLYRKINFLLKVLSRNIFNSKKTDIFLKGFCIFESSSAGSRCTKHIHIIIKDDSRLDLKKPFIDTFTESINRLKVMINDNYTSANDFSKECYDVKPIYDQKHLIGYLTDEFWKDRNGDFIKLIHNTGLVI